MASFPTPSIFEDMNDMQKLIDEARELHVPRRLLLQQTMSPDAYDKCQRVKKEWQEFSQELLSTTIPDGSNPLVPAPNINTIQLFLKWCLLRKKGHHGKLTATTLKTKWHAIARATKHEAKHLYDTHDKREMISYIDRVLVADHGASTKSRPKPLANMQVVKDVLYYLWACDEYTFKHSRVRVQLSFAILIMAYQGLRPGEFVLSSAHRDKNEGLLYRDITLTAIPFEGRIKWILQVKIRNRKNHRDKEGDSVVHILTDQPGNPFLCLVTHYCALALADNAFAKVKSADDLVKIKRKVDIRVRPEMANVPIFLGLTPAGQVSDGRILTVDSLDSLLVGLGRRAGYKDALTAYCFRRGFGNALVDSVTSVQRRQRMGYKSDDTFLYYISNKSGIDTQSIVLGHNQQTEVIDFVRSMAVDVNQSAPVPHGSRLTYAKRRYGGKASSSSSVTFQDAQDDLDKSDQEFLTVPKMSTRQHYEVRRRARRLDYSKEQSKFFSTLDEFDDDVGADQDASSVEPYEGLSTVRPGPS